MAGPYCLHYKVAQLNSCRTLDIICVVEYSWETESLSLLPGYGREHWLTPGGVEAELLPLDCVQSSPGGKHCWSIKLLYQLGTEGLITVGLSSAWPGALKAVQNNFPM